jgi:hypothetical protein
MLSRWTASRRRFFQNVARLLSADFAASVS